MPVRKIPKNYLGVTGSFSSFKNGRALGFESLLERDHMIILEFDDTVESFEEQPVKIPVKRKGKPTTSYVPDILIHFRPTSDGKPRKPLLVEDKTQRDLDKNAEKYAAKFKAAKIYAAEKGWQFRKLTETDIRKPCLPNLKFLREYHRINPDPQDSKQVLDVLAQAGGKEKMDVLLDRLCQSDDARLKTIPVVWHLVATGRIRVNLDEPFTDEVVLRLPRGARAS